MLRDDEKGVVYIPVSVEMLPAMEEWSEPVRFRLESLNGDLSFVFERLALQPVALTKGRGA